VKRTKLLCLLTVPAAAHVNPSSKLLSLRRVLAGFFIWVLLSGLGSMAPTPSLAATACGGAGQRACCVGERIPSCNSGLHEVVGCTGVCTCGGVNPFGVANSIGHCEANAPPPPPPTACGGNGQRACCVTERVPSCNLPLIEIPGCTGNCTCGGVNPGGLVKAIGHCAPLPGIPQQPATTQTVNSCSAELAKLNAALAAVAAANQAVQKQCAQAGGAQQLAPATTAPSGLLRPVSPNTGVGGLPPSMTVAPTGLQRPIAK